LQDYLAHIIQAIQRIHQYTEDIDEVGFLQNEMVQDAVIRNIEIIGEARTISTNIILPLPNRIQNCLWYSLTKCAMPLPMDILK